METDLTAKNTQKDDDTGGNECYLLSSLLLSSLMCMIRQSKGDGWRYE